jgi:hypothetical protein
MKPSDQMTATLIILFDNMTTGQIAEAMVEYLGRSRAPSLSYYIDQECGIGVLHSLDPGWFHDRMAQRGLQWLRTEGDLRSEICAFASCIDDDYGSDKMDEFVEFTINAGFVGKAAPSDNEEKSNETITP